MTALIIKNLCKSFGEDISVLNNVELTVNDNEVVFLIGRSGSGKTTLLELLSGIEKPDSGEILLDGIDISRASQKKLSEIRLRKIGFIFQQHNLIEELSVLENVYLPLRLRKEKGYQKEAEKLLCELQMDSLKHRIVKDLSLGEHQRVAIARALIIKPKLILADEPTASLDKKNAEKVKELLENIHKKFGATILVVTHDRIFDDMEGRRFHLVKGKLQEMGEGWKKHLELE